APMDLDPRDENGADRRSPARLHDDGLRIRIGTATQHRAAHGALESGSRPPHHGRSAASTPEHRGKPQFSLGNGPPSLEVGREGRADRNAVSGQIVLRPRRAQIKRTINKTSTTVPIPMYTVPPSDAPTGASMATLVPNSSRFETVFSRARRANR